MNDDHLKTLARCVPFLTAPRLSNSPCITKLNATILFVAASSDSPITGCQNPTKGHINWRKTQTINLMVSPVIFGWIPFIRATWMGSKGFIILMPLMRSRSLKLSVLSRKYPNDT